MQLGFTGISSPYEIPHQPDLMIDTNVISTEKAIEMIVNKLVERVCLHSLPVSH